MGHATGGDIYGLGLTLTQTPFEDDCRRKQFSCFIPHSILRKVFNCECNKTTFYKFVLVLFQLDNDLEVSMGG